MEIEFGEEYDLEKYTLIEVPPAIVDNIHNGDRLVLKGNEVSILCTDKKSYELRYLETSNSLYLLRALNFENEQIKNAEILFMSNHIIECTEVIPKKYSIINKIKYNCSLNYDERTGRNNLLELKKYKLDDLFAETELCLFEFKKLLEHYHIFQLNDGVYMFSESFIFKIIENILSLFSRDSLCHTNFSIEDVFNKNLCNLDEKFHNVLNNFSVVEKKNILLYISDIINDKYNSNKMLLDQPENSCFIDEKFKLNLDKIKFFCVKNIFAEKDQSIKLSAFVELLKNTLRIILPTELLEIENSNNFKYLEENTCEDNLFEFYKDYDLSYLAVEELSEKFEVRLKEVFEIKDKWTINEITPYFSDFHFSNIEEKLTKYCKIIYDSNPFEPKRQCSYYLLKFKLF